MAEPWYFIDKEELKTWVDLLQETDLVYARLRGDGRTVSITFRSDKIAKAIPARLTIEQRAR